MILSDQVKVVVGSGGDEYDGWICLDQRQLDILNEADWKDRFEYQSIDVILAEHVLEHLHVGATLRALEISHKYIKPGGWFRIAVPDGYHPSKSYIDAVKPGGTGAGAHDHKILWTIDTLSAVIKATGFDVRPLEFMDRSGQFHFNKWSVDDGLVKRSCRYDGRNKDGHLNYTSLIIDAVKTGGASVERGDLCEEWRRIPGGPRNSYSSSMTRSAEAKAPLTALGEPIPWYTYPAIEFIDAYLEKRDRSSMRVFEFGAGNSTLYYLRKQVGNVHSVETDKVWVDSLKAMVGDNARLSLIHRNVQDAPATLLEQGGQKFDLVIVDGRRRNECALYAHAAITPNGLLIFDNSDRQRYRYALEFLSFSGLYRMDFYGLSPGVQWKTCTSIFFKNPEILRALPYPSDMISCLGPTLGTVER